MTDIEYFQQLELIPVENILSEIADEWLIINGPAPSIDVLNWLCDGKPWNQNILKTPQRNDPIFSTPSPVTIESAPPTSTSPQSPTRHPYFETLSTKTLQRLFGDADRVPSTEELLADSNPPIQQQQQSMGKWASTGDMTPASQFMKSLLQDKTSSSAKSSSKELHKTPSASRLPVLRNASNSSMRQSSSLASLS